MSTVPTTLEEQVQWLADRTAILELFAEHARCLDEKDWEGLQSLFAEDGYMIMPYDRIPADQMAARGERYLGPYLGTVHMSSNHAIRIDGDEASARAYFFAVHVTSQDQCDHADVGGWYDATFRRVDGEWKYVVLDDVFVWRGGQRSLPDETVGPPE